MYSVTIYRDHAGGNKKLMSEYPQISCYGYDHDKIEGLNCTVKHEQTWNVSFEFTSNIFIYYLVCLKF